jgi:hypothetical protein
MPRNVFKLRITELAVKPVSGTQWKGDDPILQCTLICGQGSRSPRLFPQPTTAVACPRRQKVFECNSVIELTFPRQVTTTPLSFAYLVLHWLVEGEGNDTGYQVMGGCAIDLLTPNANWDIGLSDYHTHNLTERDFLSATVPWNAKMALVGRLCCKLDLQSCVGIGIDCDKCRAFKSLRKSDEVGWCKLNRRRAEDAYHALKATSDNHICPDLPRYTVPFTRGTLPMHHIRAQLDPDSCTVDGQIASEMFRLGCRFAGMTPSQFVTLVNTDPVAAVRGPYRLGLSAVVNTTKYQTDHDAFGRCSERFTNLYAMLEALAQAGKDNKWLAGDCEDSAIFFAKLHVGVQTLRDDELTSITSAARRLARAFVATPLTCVVTTPAPGMVGGGARCTHTTCVLVPITSYNHMTNRDPHCYPGYMQQYSTPISVSDPRLVLCEGTAMVCDEDNAVVTHLPNPLNPPRVVCQPTPERITRDQHVRALMGTNAEVQPVYGASDLDWFYHHASQFNTPDNCYYLQHRNSGQWGADFYNLLIRPCDYHLECMYPSDMSKDELDAADRYNAVTFCRIPLSVRTAGVAQSAADTSSDYPLGDGRPLGLFRGMCDDRHSACCDTFRICNSIVVRAYCSRPDDEHSNLY